MPCFDRYSMHRYETGLENNSCVEFWTFSVGGDQQPATADSGSCPRRCECRQLSSPMCYSAMWGWGSLCARDGLLHVWMCTRLSWHTVPATRCPHHATGHTNPQVCWWQLSPLQWSWHNAKASSKLKMVNQSHYRPEVATGFQEVRVPRSRDIGPEWWQGCQPYAPAVFTSRKYSWYSFLLEAKSTPGP